MSGLDKTVRSCERPGVEKSASGRRIRAKQSMRRLCALLPFYPIAARSFNDRPRDCAVQMNFAARTCSPVKT
jgi:hypothetical protein